MKLFDGGEYSCDWVSRVVCCLLENALALKKSMGNQLTIAVLEVSQHICHSVVDEVFLQLWISVR